VTRAEVLELVASIVERWPHSPVAPDQYERDLTDLHAPYAHAAVDALYRDGERFAPNGGQIIRWIANAAIDAPPWGKVKAEIDRRRAGAGGARWSHDGRACPHGSCDGRGIVVDDDARTSRYCTCRSLIRIEVAEASGMHPLVSQFVAEVGRQEIAALDGNRTAEAQVRDKYEAFMANARRGVAYTGIPTAGLPALERLAREQAQRAGQLDPGEQRGGLRVVEGGRTHHGPRPIGDAVREIAGGEGQ
jgi:hypothetical protein